jgi:hypothetical protein
MHDEGRRKKEGTLRLLIDVLPRAKERIEAEEEAIWSGNAK